MAAAGGKPIYLLAAAMRAHRAVFAWERCDDCGAMWEGDGGDECGWCAEALERQRQWHAEQMLQAPEVDPDDIRYDGVMQGWAERLAVAVGAELITRQQAERAWKRATTREL